MKVSPPEPVVVTDIEKAMAEANIGAVVLSYSELKHKLRGLKKELTQIDRLKSRVESGELSAPSPDELSMIAKRDEVVQQMDEVKSQM